MLTLLDMPLVRYKKDMEALGDRQKDQVEWMIP